MERHKQKKQKLTALRTGFLPGIAVTECKGATRGPPLIAAELLDGLLWPAQVNQLCGHWRAPVLAAPGYYPVSGAGRCCDGGQTVVAGRARCALPFLFINP